MVPAQKVVIATDLQWKRKKRSSQSSISNMTYNAQVVPFLDNLKYLLANKDVRSNIEGHRLYNCHVLRTVLDGSYYNENEFFKNNKNALAIIMYYDDVGLVNPLGASAKTHKYSMFYWTLANLNPKVRSTLNTVQLYAIVKTAYLKKPNALEKILEPFIKDINTLQSIGIDIDVGGGKIRNFKGSLFFCAGDTPASAMLGGFKESVAAYRPCRSCTTTNAEWKLNFRDNCFVPRNSVSHQEHLDIINDETITQVAKEFWQKHYGVNKTSPLINIPYFDVTTCLPQDAMHILIEGPVEILCRVYLQYCIKNLKLFTIDDFNQQLLSFDFKHFKNNKPAPIQSNHLESTLHQSAAQLITLAHTLPFLIGEWIISCEDAGLKEHTFCYVQLLQILNVCLAYEIDQNSIDLLSLMIESFICRFNNLYPNLLIPKFHFLVHIPRYIKLFGPPRQQWCFRFEATHAYFKGLISVVRNFKYIAATLAYRHQARLCSKLSSCPGMPAKKFLYQGDYVAPGNIILLNNLPYARLFHEFVDENEWFTCQMMRSPKIIIFGTLYQLESIILLECNADDMPLFGEINDIYILDDKKLLVVSLLETQNYEETLNAYYVKNSLNLQKSVINTKNLIFPHPLSSFNLMGKKYVPLINHQRTEFYG